VSRSAAARGAP